MPLIPSKDLIEANVRLDMYEERTRELQEQVDRLMDTIIEMKREGFTMPTPAPDPGEASFPELSPEVMAAITQIADPSEPLYTKLLREAETLTAAEGSTPEKVAESILAGGNYQPWDRM